MAQNESDREDLMIEAVSLIRRIECQSADAAMHSIVGINAVGWLFVYVGNDLMYRFDAEGRLRRAFVDNLLYRTSGTSLSQLERRKDHVSVGGPMQTTLVRRDLSSKELEEFRQMTHRNLAKVVSAITNGKVTRQVPCDGLGLADEMLQAIHHVLAAREFLAPTIVRR